MILGFRGLVSGPLFNLAITLRKYRHFAQRLCRKCIMQPINAEENWISIRARTQASKPIILINQLTVAPPVP